MKTISSNPVSKWFSLNPEKEGQWHAPSGNSVIIVHFLMFRKKCKWNQLAGEIQAFTEERSVSVWVCESN